MKQVHIYAYGDIENFQGSIASDYGIVSLKMFSDVLNSNTDADELIVHIHSRGGDVDEGFAIHDLLVNSGKKITTIVEGLCASIATVVFLAGSERKMTKNSEFLIHNPWAMGIGTAEDFNNLSNELKDAENKLANLYVEKTGKEIEDLKALMNEDKRIPSSEALSLGFATEILEPIKAYAKIKIDNMNKNEKTFFDKINAKLDNFLKSIKNEEPVQIKNVEKMTKDGKTVIVETEEDPKVGDVVTVDNEPAPNQEIELEDGTIYVTDADSKIAEVKLVEAAPEENEELARLRKENEELKQTISNQTEKLSAMENDMKDNSDEVVKLSAKLETVLKSIKSNYTPKAEETRFNHGTEPAKVNAFEEARKRLKK